MFCCSRIKKNIKLTPLEIQKLQKNLSNLIDFCDESHNYSNTIIDEVYRKLQTASNEDKKLYIFDNFLCSVFEELIGSEIPVAPYIAFAFSAIINSYTEDNKPNLNKDFGNLEASELNTSLAIRQTLSEFYQNPQSYIDKVYILPFQIKKTFTLRELLNVDIPDKNSLDFSNSLIYYTRAFRTLLTKMEIPKISGKYFMLTVNFLNDEIADASYSRKNDPLGTVFYWDSQIKQQIGWSSEQAMIHCNNPVILEIEADKSNDYNSYIKCISTFAGDFGPAFMVDINTSPDGRFFFFICYYISTAIHHPEFSVASWDLGDVDFFKWLFIDDGFGNIINENGCGMRDDVIRNWGFMGANDMLYKHGEKLNTQLLFKCNENNLI